MQYLNKQAEFFCSPCDISTFAQSARWKFEKYVSPHHCDPASVNIISPMLACGTIRVIHNSTL